MLFLLRMRTARGFFANGFFAVGWMFASVSVLLNAPDCHAQINEAELQKSFPHLAAALAQSDTKALRSELDALAPADKQRILTALHAMRVSPSNFQSTSNSSMTNGGFGDLQSRSSAGGAGGASMANFTELMNLIETTIAPDQWTNAGGTATISPFRSGVRICPTAVIERLEIAKQEGAPKLRLPATTETGLVSPSIALDDLGPWQHPTALRWISLHQLDRELHAESEEGHTAGIAAELLGGLCRIDYLAFDAATGEWLLGGPAGDIASCPDGTLLHKKLKLPPVLLEDLLTVSSHVLHQQGEFGCSIDPDPTRLVDAYAMANQPASLRLLRRDPEGWAEQWKSKLGMQKTMIVGIAEDSPTGFALLVADAHMKRLAFGLEPSVNGLKNYWLEADLVQSKPSQSMVRWWFSMAKTRIPYDPENHLYRFEESNVEVLSETQMLSQIGQRVKANAPDAAADAFARNFTTHFEKLQQRYPEYGRLRHIFDLTVAVEIVRAEIAAGHGKPFAFFGRSDVLSHLPVAPKLIDSIIATRSRSDGSVSAIVSGGVSIDPISTDKRLRLHRSLANEVSIESSPGTSEIEGSLDKVFWR